MTSLILNNLALKYNRFIDTGIILSLRLIFPGTEKYSVPKPDHNNPQGAA